MGLEGRVFSLGGKGRNERASSAVALPRKLTAFNQPGSIQISGDRPLFPPLFLLFPSLLWLNPICAQILCF